VNVIHSAKQQFQEQTEVAQKWRTIVIGRDFNTALTHAISHYCQTCHPTTEQLEGVRRFTHEFLNLAEKEEPLPHFPEKRLNYRPQPKPEPQEEL
jgi:hypothetical protein